MTAFRRTHRVSAAVVLALVAIAATPAIAQVSGAPRLIRDLAVTDISLDSSYPRGFVAAGPWVYFSAQDPLRGNELWRTDGTVAGTQIVVDLDPGPDGGAWIGWKGAAALGGELVFQGTTHRQDGEPYITDGTAAGTRRIADAVPGPWGTYPEELHPAAGLVYFVGLEDATGYEAWRTDGTAAGTFRLADLVPGIDDSWADGFTAVNGVVVFDADATAFGEEPHVTDGTVAGTRLLADILPGPEGSSPDDFVLVGGTLYFSARGPEGRELWMTDGTTPGTVLVADIIAGPDGSNPSGLVDLGGVLHFFASGPNGRGLWRSDGTVPGTRVVRDADTVPPYWTADSDQGVVVSGLLVFSARDDASGSEPWATDGTVTALLADAEPGPAGSDPHGFASDGARAWFAATTTAAGRELWVTDGSGANTRMAADIRPGPGDGVERLFEGDFGLGLGRAFFPGCTDGEGCEPWTSDGTPAGTRMLANIQPETAESDPLAFLALEGVATFTANGIVGDAVAPWLTDGTPGGTRRIGDTTAGPIGLTHSLALSGSRLLMTGVAPTQGESRPWLADLRTGDAVLADSPGRVRVGFSARPVGPGVFLGVDDRTGRGEDPGLWDGATFSQLTELTPGPSGGVGGVIGRTRVDAIFQASTPATGNELFASDGTGPGTRLVADLSPGPDGTDMSWGCQVGDRVVFDARPTGGTRALWGTDGTTGGTQRLADGWTMWRGHEIVVGGWEIDSALTGGGLLVIALTQPATGTEPWVTDGTPGGTQLLVDLNPGPASSIPQDFEPMNGLVVFAATDPVSGHELFVTDGTPTGTRVVADIVPGTAGSAPSDLRALAPGGPVIFAAWTAASGREPWITDGTASGTVPLAEVVPGPDSSTPAEFTPAGMRVVFSARGGPEGREPWTYDLVTAPEAGNCLDGVDNDGDNSIDCADSDCASSPACSVVGDPDGDGAAGADDCAPRDPSSWRVPAEPHVDVRRSGASGAALTWDDLAPAAGPGVLYEIAGDVLASLRAGTTRPCLASGLAATTWTDVAPPAERWYLVRGVNACADPAPGSGWGTDSLGAARLGCP
jgi:ELWxxDGT repeat protein